MASRSCLEHLIPNIFLSNIIQCYPYNMNKRRKKASLGQYLYIQKPCEGPHQLHSHPRGAFSLSFHFPRFPHFPH